MHLFATVAELAASRSSKELLVRDAWLRVTDARPLFVAALLHDIGKGRGGDHSEIGTRMAADVAARMRLGAAEVTDVAFLVRSHLELASLATRRDLNEPRTISSAARRVGTSTRLAMLFLLTRADSKSTGAEAWSTFRASLVGELYTKTLLVLEGRTEAAESPPRREAPLVAEPLADGEVRTDVSVRDEAHEEVLPTLVHVIEVAVLLELARVVPRPHRAADRTDSDIRSGAGQAAASALCLLRRAYAGVPSADVVAVLRVVDHRQPAAVARHVDP